MIRGQVDNFLSWNCCADGSQGCISLWGPFQNAAGSVTILYRGKSFLNFSLDNFVFDILKPNIMYRQHLVVDYKLIYFAYLLCVAAMCYRLSGVITA